MTIVQQPASPLPVVEFANPNPYRVDRWATFCLPQEAIPPGPRLLNGALCWPGRRIGVLSQQWHRWVSLEAGETKRMGDWATVTAPLPTPSPLDSVSPARIMRCVPEAIATVNGNEIRGVLVPSSQQWDSMVSMSLPCEVHGAGWHAVVWLTFWSGTQTIDFRGYILWRDSSITAWTLHNVTLALEWNNDLGSIDVTMHDAHALGITKAEYNGKITVTLGTFASLPDGVCIPFRGELCEADTRVFATAVWPNGKYLGDGSRPDVLRSSRVNLDSVLATAGTIIRPRLGASALDPGSTGSQPCFGAVKGLDAAGGNAWALRELMWAADDGLMRAGHYLENNGELVGSTRHPSLETWSLAVERHSTDQLGKATVRPTGWDAMGSRKITVDDQHRGDGPQLAAYALTGDRMLEADILFRLHVDKMGAKLRRNQVDSPRAAGRLWQSWAKMALLAPPLVRTRIAELSELLLDIRIAHWDNRGAVRPLMVTSDPRLLADYPAWKPWEDALAVLGAVEQARTWERLGVLDLAERFHNFAAAVANNFVDYGTMRDNHKRPVVIYAVRKFPDGDMPPAGFYDPAAPWVGYGSSGGAGIQILMSQSNWWDWCACALRYAAEVVENDKAKEYLAELGPDGTIQSAEWWCLS